MPNNVGVDTCEWVQRKLSEAGSEWLKNIRRGASLRACSPFFMLARVFVFSVASHGVI